MLMLAPLARNAPIHRSRLICLFVNYVCLQQPVAIWPGGMFFENSTMAGVGAKGLSLAGAQ
jgi:hypothetical protein